MTDPADRDWFGILGDGLVVVLTPRRRSWRLEHGDKCVAACRRRRAGHGVHRQGRRRQDNTTALRVLVAEEMGVPLGRVRLAMGDTDLCPYDMGNLRQPVDARRGRGAAQDGRVRAHGAARQARRATSRARRWRASPIRSGQLETGRAPAHAARHKRGRDWHAPVRFRSQPAGNVARRRAAPSGPWADASLAQPASTPRRPDIVVVRTAELAGVVAADPQRRQPLRPRCRLRPPGTLRLRRQMVSLPATCAPTRRVAGRTLGRAVR